jgi:hypothetical protein
MCARAIGCIRHGEAALQFRQLGTEKIRVLLQPAKVFGVIRGRDRKEDVMKKTQSFWLPSQRSAQRQ